MLLKIVPKTHPQLQAYLIDLYQYNPTWWVGIDLEAPKVLRFKNEHEVEVLPPEFVENMAMAEKALQ